MLSFSRSLRRRRGSLLIEALLSVVILSVSMVTINQSMTASLRSLVYSEDYTRALVLLENQMFDLMYLGFIEDGQHKTWTMTDDERFVVKVDTQAVGSRAESHLNKLDAEIVWKNGKRKNNIALQTYLFNPQDEQN